MRYYLYRNGILIAILAGSTNSYEDYDQPKRKQTYSLVAVNTNGNSSAPNTALVGGKR